MKKSIACVLACLPLMACVTGTIVEPEICAPISLGTFPGSPIAISNPPPISYSINEDFSSTISKIKQVADGMAVSVSSLDLTSSSSLGFVSDLVVYVQPTDLSQPRALLASYQSTVATGDGGTMLGGDLAVTVEMDSETLLAYLSVPVVLTFSVVATEAPTTTTMLNANFCVAASASITKKL